jgi:uncharacterized protein YegJ (DUF2314 family)
MQKLLLHIAVACAIWFGATALGAPWWLRALALIPGAFMVHWIWERFMFQPFAYLGAMPVSNDDPVMAEARAKAKETFGNFRELYPEHRSDSVVRFALKTDDGNIEKVWGDLLELEESKAKIYLRTPPVGKVNLPERTMEIAVSDIEDWQIAMRDGSIRGAYTIMALCKIFEREEGYMHPKFKEHLERFVDR